MNPVTPLLSTLQPTPQQLPPQTKPSAFSGRQEVRNQYVGQGAEETPIDLNMFMQQANARNSAFDMNPNVPLANGAINESFYDYSRNQSMQPAAGFGTQPATGLDGQLAALRKREGKYDSVGDIGDGAGLSVGAYQFTEKSGRVQQLTKQLGISNYGRLNRGQRTAALGRVINTPTGRRAQDDLIKAQYFAPAQKVAARYGVKDPKAIEFIVDTNVNGGMHNVIKRAKGMGGLSLANLKRARLDRYDSLIRKNPGKYGKFKKGWANRVNNF